MKNTSKTVRTFPSTFLAASALAIATVMTTTACSDLTSAISGEEQSNYFASDSTLPFMAPDFSKIDEDDYIPAFEEGMKIQQAEVQAIIDNEQEPTFDNTIVALEKSGRMLGRVSRVFSALTGANTTDGLDAIDSEISPKLSDHSSSITLNPDLFARVKSVYEQRESLELGLEEAKLLEKTYEDMVKAGAELSEEQRERVKEINGELTTLTTEFSQMVRDASNSQALVVDTAEELAGLPQSAIDAAANKAGDMGEDGKFAVALQNTTQQPALPDLENRDVREKLFKLSYHRSDGTNPDYDTRPLIAKIAKLRAEKAALFNRPDWASYVLQDNMAKEPSIALGFMEQMVPALAETQRAEAQVLNEKIASEGGNFEVQPWDWYRYANKVRADRYELNSDEVKAYFQLDRVLEDGVFYMANKLYGLSFERRNDIPVYHPDVWVYTVKEEDGSELGLFYFDPFQRPSKRGGAWMSNFVDQSYEWGTKPVIYNVLNIAKAPEGEVQLASFDDVETTFHEFGHALHGLFADQRFESLSGTATARDFVEYPSQVHEMWAVWPEVLQNYAKHYETGEFIPMELIEKMEAASKFNQGYDFGEVVAAALLDMKWSALTPEEAAKINTPEDVTAFEKNSLAELGLEVDLVPPRYRSSYFNHIFSGPTGYSAGYYSYLWTQMLDHDNRNYITQNGGLTRENGQRLREKVLSRGGTMEFDEVYRQYAERDPDVKYMLAHLGLLRD